MFSDSAGTSWKGGYIPSTTGPESMSNSTTEVGQPLAKGFVMRAQHLPTAIPRIHLRIFSVEAGSTARALISVAMTLGCVFSLAVLYILGSVCDLDNRRGLT